MSNVRLNIGGRDFSVAVAPGQEEHIAMLGRQIDDRLRTNGAPGNSESRMLLLAALLMADEANELRNGGSVPAPAPTPVPAPAPAAAAQPDNAAELARLCAGVEAAADRLEKLAAHLESALAEP